jgi:hypothetical protein
VDAGLPKLERTHDLAIVRSEHHQFSVAHARDVGICPTGGKRGDVRLRARGQRNAVQDLTVWERQHRERVLPLTGHPELVC